MHEPFCGHKGFYRRRSYSWVVSITCGRLFLLSSFRFLEQIVKRNQENISGKLTMMRKEDS